MAKKPVQKKSKAPPKPTQPEEDAPPPDTAPTVDRLLIALQKTFSRVSRDSRVGDDPKLPKAGEARALIVGAVGFEITTHCTLTPDDRLLIDAAGGSPLKLNGTLNTDVGVQAVEGGDDVEPVE